MTYEGMQIVYLKRELERYKVANSFVEKALKELTTENEQLKDKMATMESICNKLGVERGRKETAEDICLLISCVPEPRLMNQAFVIGKIKERFGLEI
jgi:hypothetical protein